MAQYYTDPSTGQHVKIQKTHKIRNFVVLPIVGVMAVGIIVAAASGGSSSPAAVAGNGSVPTASQTESSAGHTVRYEVTGDGQGMITYTTDGNMSMSQATETLPWNTELTMGNSFFTPVSVSVTRSYQGGTGPLGCKIIVDGKTVTENHSAGGQFSTVSCNGSVQ